VVKVGQETQGRIDGLIATYNATFEGHQADISSQKASLQQIYDKCEVSFTQMQDKVGLADLEIANMTEELAKQKEALAKISEGVDQFANNTRAAAAETEKKIRTDLTDWSKQLRSDILGSFLESGGIAAGPPGIGQSSTGRQASVDRKDISIGELADAVSKPDFRHWLEIVDTNLEAIHCFRYPDIILDKVKRFKEEITVTNWPTIVKQANEEVAKIRAEATSGTFSSPD
jgi:hypothetical protein